ncbi:hypothetical protein Stsp01_64130 [Streptomyces sp. NBRC 13847]|nr:hypothetical protein Stsp01_64130 [Streptomyces sp. NBRC 13847]
MDVPLWFPIAIAWGAAVAEIPTTDAATAVVARTFLITIYPSRSGVPVSGAPWSTHFRGSGFAVSPECHETNRHISLTLSRVALPGLLGIRKAGTECVPAFAAEAPPGHGPDLKRRMVIRG